VNPRAGLDDVEKRKFLTLTGLELQSLGRPARRKSLYPLSDPGSHIKLIVFVIIYLICLYLYCSTAHSSNSWFRDIWYFYGLKLIESVSRKLECVWLSAIGYIPFSRHTIQF
jgi:hypothetical protein